MGTFEPPTVPNESMNEFKNVPRNIKMIWSEMAAVVEFTKAWDCLFPTVSLPAAGNHRTRRLRHEKIILKLEFFAPHAALTLTQSLTSVAGALKIQIFRAALLSLANRWPDFGVHLIL